MDGWNADYAWDPYRLVAVEDSSAAAMHANALQLGTQPETLVPPVLPGPALPSAAASRASKAMCKVEGCERLLRDEKLYYQRFLVCEEHMRCLSLDINGQLSRFCQQCGKFEPVEAFDNNKRSCRARLQEHNKRRRKMGVSSRSLRKHRRNAAAANKAAKAAAAAAMGAEPMEQQADADGDSDAEVAADGAVVDTSAQPAGDVWAAAAAAVGPTSSSNAALPPSRGSSSGPTQQQQAAGGGTAAAAVAGACARGDAAATADAEIAVEGGALLLAPAAGGCRAADPPACWIGGLLSDLQPVQEQQQLLASPTVGRQQAQHLGWLKDETAALQPAAVPASPTISDIFQGDSIMADVADLAQSEVVQPVAMLLPPSLLYESSLFKPTEVAPRGSQAEQQLPAAMASAGAAAGSSRQASGTRDPLAPLQAQGKQGQHGSSCSSSGAVLVASSAAAAGAMFSEEDRRLLDQLLAESAEHIGTALQPGPAAAAPAAAAQAVTGKRYRSLQHDPAAAAPVLYSAACAEYAQPLPNIALAALPPITQRDDSAEDHRLCIGGGNSSSDSGGSSKRQKQRTSAPYARSNRHSAREVEATQLTQQQLQYQQLQALQQQLQHSLLSGPYTQPLQQLPPQPMMCGVAGMASGVSPAASAAAAAAAAVAAIKPDAPRDLSFDQQLENIMQRTGLAQQQQQMQPPAAALAAAAAGSSAGFAGMQGSLSLAPQGAAAFGGSQWQLQEQQLFMAQYMSMYGMSATYQGPGTGGYGMPGMSSAAGWAGAAAPATAGAGAPAAPAAPEQWQVPGAGHQQQQAQQQQTWMQQALATAQGGAGNASYQPVDTSMRMSIKLHGAQPSQLQPEMLPRMNSLLAGSYGGASSSTAAGPGLHVECGYMRPGCVHLVLQLRSPADVQAAVEALAAAGQGADPACWRWALMNSSPGSSVDSTAADQQQALSITVQLGNHSVLVVQDGKPDPAGALVLQQLLQQPQGSGISGLGVSMAAGISQQQQPPQVQTLLPCCISSLSTAANGRCQLLVVGSRLAAAPDGSAPAPVPLARCQGMFLAAAAVPATPTQASVALQLLQYAQGSQPNSSGKSAVAAEAAPAADSCAAVVIEGLQPYGLVHVEFMQGLLLSEAQPLLVVDDDAVAAEVQALQRAVLAGGDSKREAERILVDFGRLLDFRAAAERHMGSSLQGGDSSSTAEDEPHPPGRVSSSAPIPYMLQEVVADAADAPCSCGNNLASHQQPAGQAASSHTGSIPLAKPVPAPHVAEQRSGPSRAPSRESSSSSLRSSLRSLFGSSRPPRAEDSSVGRRSSFALEQRSAQQSAEDAGGETGERDASVSCFPTRRLGLRSSFSFSRRHSFALEAAQPSVSSDAGGAVPDGAGREGTSAWLAGQVDAGHAVQGGHSSVTGQHGDEQRQRRRSFGDVLLCRSGSLRTVSGFGFGARAEQQPSDAEGSAHGVSMRSRSDLGPRTCVEQPVQPRSNSSSEHAEQQEEEEGNEVASAEGDSVSSFPTLEHPSSTSLGMQEHPLLTASYKGLMMEIGVRLLCYFLDRGWAASARMVLTTLLKHAAPMASFRAVASAVTACNGEQLGILHRAVRSGEVAAITEVLGWAVQHQTPLVWDAKGPRGLTPLHLLALTGCKSMLPPHALQPGTALQPSLAAMVLQTSPGLCTLWFNTFDDAGLTPAWYASRAGADSINQLASGCIMLGGSVPSSSGSAAPSPHSRSRASTARPMPSAPTGSPAAASAAKSPSSPAQPATAATPAWQQFVDDSAHNRTVATGTAEAFAEPAAMQPALLLQAATDEPLPSSAAAQAAPQQVAADAVSAQGLPGAGAHEELLQDSSTELEQQQEGQDSLGALVPPVASSSSSSIEGSLAGSQDSAEDALVVAARTDPHGAEAAAASATAPMDLSSSSSGSIESSMTGSQAPVEVAAVVAAGTGHIAAPSAAAFLDHASSGSSSSRSACAAAAEERLLQARQPAGLQPSPAVVALAGLMSACQQALQAHPQSWQHLQRALHWMRALWVFLLLQCVVHGSLGLMLFALAAGTVSSLLLRLLPVIAQPLVSSGLTDAVELQSQLGVLLRHVCTPLPLPHNPWLLTFENPCQEKHYQQILAEARQPVDAVISVTIKGLISLQPLLHNLCSQFAVLRLLGLSTRQWNMPTMQLLTAAAAAGLPLVVALTNPRSAHSMRDHVLFLTHASLLVILRKPLLSAAATSAAAGGAAVVAGAGIAGSGQLFHGCVAALLLLLFRQRLCWATWQAMADTVLGLVLLTWDLSAASPLPAWQTCLWSLLHVLLPVLVLPFLYLREKVDRQIAVAALLEQKQLKLKEC